MSRLTKNPISIAIVALAVAVGSAVVATSPAYSGPGDPVGAPTQFQAVEPCRVVDTRNLGDPGQVGRLGPGEVRLYDVLGTRGAPYFIDQGAPGCNIPAGVATAVELTFTAVDPELKGFLRAWPAGSGPTADGATVVNYTGGLSLNPTNSVTVAVSAGSWDGTSGELGVRNYGGYLDLVIDVTGYYRGSAATVPVYYLIDTANEFRLAREFVRIEGASDDPATAAVTRMLTGPAEDPDYATPWNPQTQLRSIDVAGGVITVDLSDDARTANVGAASAELAVQQLVYTVTAALQEPLPVMLLIEGQPAGELWGHVVWDAPISRAPELDVRLLVQINDPGQGASVPASFTVTGEAAVFEATLPWQILNSSGTVVQQGFAMTADGSRLAPFKFLIDFTGAPGTYTLRIEESDPSGGEGGPVMSDDKTITIG